MPDGRSAATRAPVPPRGVDDVTQRTSWGDLPWIASLLTLVATGLVVWRGAEDPFVAPKLVVLGIGATVAGLGVVVTGWRRVEGVLAAMVGAVVGVMLLATALAEAPRWALVGPPGRGTGVLAYAALAVLALAASTGSARSGVWLLVAVAAAGGVQGAVLVAQAAGVDPFSWTGVSPLVGTMGNPNFGAAACAFAVPAGVALALRDGSPRSGAAAVGAVVLAVGGIVAAASAQGWVAGLTGLAVVVAASVPRLGRVPRARVVGGVIVAALLVALGAALVLRSDAPSVVERRQGWAAAATVVGDHPVVGVGQGGYALAWTAARPAAAAADRPLRALDDPHSVPLAMAASGGVLLALAYGVLVVATGVRGVRAVLRARERAERAVAAGVVGVWLGYQVQSSVSIDQPGLSVVHWVSLGTIWALSAPSTTARWPTRALAVGLWAATALMAVVSVQVLRAEAHLRSASAALASGDVRTAQVEIREAESLRPDDARYATAALRLETAEGAPATRVAELARRAEALAPGLPEPWQDGALAWRRAGRLDEAQEWFAGWREVDPHNPVALAGAAEVEALRGDEAQGRRLLDDALAPEPGSAGGWLAVGDAALALGDTPTALWAYDRALTAPEYDSASAIARVAEARGDPWALLPDR